MPRYRIRATTIVPAAVVVVPGGQTIIAGATVDLPQQYGDHLADELLAVRVPDEPPDDPRDAAIVRVIDALSPARFTRAGKPEVDAINDRLPSRFDRVTAKDRDRIWATMIA